MMTAAAEQAVAGPAECCVHIGKTRGCEDHDHDLVQELSIRLDAIWRHDQYIANAEGHDNLRDFWKQLKVQDQENLNRLKKLIAEEVKQGCF